MQFNEQGLVQDKAKWEAAGYKLPKYDRAAMIEKTKANPFYESTT